MSGCEAKVPALRFKGHPGSWERKRLGDAVTFDVTTNTLSRAELSQTGSVRNIHYGDVLIKYGSVLDITTEEVPFVADAQFKFDKKNRLLDGDVIMADTAEDETAGKVTEIRGIEEKSVVSGLHTIVLRPKERFANGFLGYCFNAPAYHDRLASIMQGSKVLSINKGTLPNTVFIAPPTETEQRRIGSLFRSLDALIAGREKALEKLEALKKSMLLKMFPQGDATVPKVRFKGFAGGWEKKRLGDVFSMSISTNTLSRVCLADIGLVKNVHYGDILTKLNSVTNVDSDALPYVADKSFKVGPKNRLKDGDIVMADTAEDEAVGKVTEIRGIGKSRVVAGLHTMVLRPLNDFGEGYLGFYLNADAFHRGLLKIMQGVKVLSISKSFLADYTLIIPSLLEQQKIGAYFRSLDALLAARREEIGKLKQMKKALLERMFV